MTTTSTTPAAKGWNILVVSPQTGQTMGTMPTNLMMTRVPAGQSLMVQSYFMWQQPDQNHWYLLHAGELAGNMAMSSHLFEHHFLPAVEQLIMQCHAVIRLGGHSKAAEEVMKQAKVLDKPVVHSWEEVQALLGRHVLAA